MKSTASVLKSSTDPDKIIIRIETDLAEGKVIGRALRDLGISIGGVVCEEIRKG